MRKALQAMLLLAVVVMCGVPAKADTVGTLVLTDCGPGSGCPGATYSFDISATQATLSITINSAPNSTNHIISGVDLGFTPSKNISNLSLVSAPPGFTSTQTGSLNNAGCGTNGGAFICSSGPGVAIVNGQTYTWIWTFNNSGGVAASGDVHIGANYNPANGLIISCTINTCGGGTPPNKVPEPNSMLLLGAGLLAVGGAAVRRGFNKV